MTAYSETTETARAYYNSDPADRFYFHVWGGEDIHIGLYHAPEDTIREASERTVEKMAGMLPKLDGDTRVIDLGAGYGGAARYLAKRFGCHVTAVNLSETQNERDRQMNREQGLDQRVDVVDGSFDETGCESGAFDVVWSEDAFLHGHDRRKILEEAYRLLKPGGHLIFTDPMQQDDCPDGVLQPIYDRIHLSSLASFGYYTKTAPDVGFSEEAIVDLTPQLTNHYSRVQAELKSRYDELVALSGQEYVDKMIAGLQHWIDGGNNGYLAWGILHFVK